MKRINQLLAVITTILLLHVAVYSQSRYMQFGNLNNASVNVTSTWTKLNTTSGVHSFTKSTGSTKIEVYVNSRFSVGTFSGASGVRFQIRIDNNPPAIGNDGSILRSNTSEFLSIFAVFQNLPAGSHTVSIWARTGSAGSASSIGLDPGGWGGMMIVKETQ